MKLDKRKNYYLTIDTETTNGLDNPLVYDIGGAIHDKQGKIYETFSFVIREVYEEMPELMATAYYADKLPEYESDLETGHRILVNYNEARKHIQYLAELYNITAILAYNMRFDYRATATTQRYLTNSRYRYFLPYGVPLWCTLTMANDVLTTQKSYKSWAKENGYMTKHKTPRPRSTAEILYRYISGDNEFVEEHKGLDDVLIEIEIFTQAIRQKKKMRKSPFREKGISEKEKEKRGWEV